MQTLMHLNLNKYMHQCLEIDDIIPDQLHHKR